MSPGTGFSTSLGLGVPIRRWDDLAERQTSLACLERPTATAAQPAVAEEQGSHPDADAGPRGHAHGEVSPLTLLHPGLLLLYLPPPPLSPAQSQRCTDPKDYPAQTPCLQKTEMRPRDVGWPAVAAGKSLGLPSLMEDLSPTGHGSKCRRCFLTSSEIPFPTPTLSRRCANAG